MIDIFQKKNEKNLFDNHAVDIKDVYDLFPVDRKIDQRPNSVSFINSPFHKIYRAPILPVKHRNYFWHLFRRLNLDLTWFDEFKKYWTTVLKGRPFWSVYDLFFLKNWYRIKFMDIEIEDTDDTFVHLDAWQRPEVLYQLLHLVCRESASEYAGILQRLKMAGCNIQKATFLEFGCATAPVTTALFEFWKGSRDLKVYISDIQTLSFNYAVYKFRNCSNVIPILLIPENDLLLQIDDRLDAIFCLTVFEHLNKPLETAKIFYNRLIHGGYLVFDYTISEGDGLDTHHGIRQRNDTIDFLSRNFELLYGNLSKETGMGLTIIRKK